MILIDIIMMASTNVNPWIMVISLFKIDSTGSGIRETDELSDENEEGDDQDIAFEANKTTTSKNYLNDE